ncbi:MAG TPA: GNAT family N-acetyltransferase [Symbiobacteriaceae bacterium]|nr:GNAT family N-acetyltransferase [Symbiobacteriaceae bacterium]
MYAFRYAQSHDLPWLDQASAISVWESLSPDESRQASPATVADLARQQLYSTIGAPGGTAIVATAWNQPVGFVLTGIAPDSSTDETNGHLVTLWVAPAHRRRGLGRALLHMAEQLLLHRGIRKVKVIAELHNQPAVRLAERAGYKPEGLIGVKPL